MKKVLKKFDINFFTIFVVALIVFASYLFSGYFRTGDSTFHIAHLLPYAESFKLSDLFGASILSDVANNFGYGTRIFYPPLGYNLIVIIFSIISKLGFHIILSMKLAYLLSVILSGVFMYLFMKKAFKNKYVAILSAIFYMTMPYHLLDIFFRDALSEIFMFTFIPLIFLGLEYLFENNYKRFYLCFISGYVFSMLSHLVLSVYLTFFVIIYLLLNYRKIFKKEIIFRLMISALLILIIVAPFIVPMIEHKFFGNYLVFYPGFMASAESVEQTTLTLGQMFKMPVADNNLFFSFSYLAVICCITVILCGIKQIDNKRVFKHFLILLIICFIMLTPLFPWSKLPSILLNIQFVWRLEVFFSFFISVLASLIVFMVHKNYQKIIVVILSSVLVIFAIYLVNLHEYKDVDLLAIKNDGIGETWGMEYLPVNTYKHHEYFLNRDDNIVVKRGKVKVLDVINETSYLEFKIKTDDRIVIELPRLYYMGYEITFNGERINYKENKNGFIEIEVSGSGLVKMRYCGTTGYKISICVLILTVIIWLMIWLFNFIKKKKA